MAVAGVVTAFAGAAAGAVVDAVGWAFVVAAAAEAPYQSFTPLCPAHAPLFVAFDVYEPSLHKPVDPVGAAEGTCANATVDAKRPATRVMKVSESFIRFSSEVNDEYRLGR